MTSSRGRHALRIGGLILALGAVGWGLRSLETGEVARAFRARTVEAGTLGSGRTLPLILQRLEVLHSTPVQLARGRAVRAAPGRSTDHLLSLDPITDDELVTVFGVEPYWLSRPVSVAALLIDPGELEALRRRPHRRGREFERTGFLAYLEDGRLETASRVGVRLHGGWTRAQPELASYRLYFRKRYGLDRLAPSPFPSRSEHPPRQVVVRRDGHRTAAGDVRQFTTSLGYDVARRLEVPAPETRPVVFYLNGRLRGVWSLSEWIHRDYLAAHFGHDDYVLVRTKGGAGGPGGVKEGDPEAFRAVRQWLRRTPRLTVAEAEAWVDLDNLSRWFLAAAFCGTEDALQGSMVLDQRDPAARWRWIAWDMDQSFGYPDSPGDWEHDNLDHLLRSTDLRSSILRFLLRDDPEFRPRLLATAAEALNHRLDRDFLAGRLAVYRDYARLYAIDELDLDPIAGWLEHRGEALRRQLAARFDVEVHGLEVESRPGVVLLVDGHRHDGGYRGEYFSGQIIAVGTEAAGPSHWRVDGREVMAVELSLEAGQATQVEWLGPGA